MSTQSDINELSHSHVFLGSAHDENARRTLWVVILTAVMMVGEIIAGTVFGPWRCLPTASTWQLMPVLWR